MPPFVGLVRAYCALIERHEALTATDLLHHAHVLLARLYTGGLALPDEPEDDEADNPDEDAQGDDSAALAHQPDPDRLGHARWRELHDALAAQIGLERNFYEEVFDPYRDPREEPVVGSVADDLADVYQDVRAGLLKWDRGERRNAVWAWRFDFTVHWSEHALGALRAIRTLADQYGLGFPPAPVVDA